MEKRRRVLFPNEKFGNHPFDFSRFSRRRKAAAAEKHGRYDFLLFRSEAILSWLALLLILTACGQPETAPEPSYADGYQAGYADGFAAGQAEKAPEILSEEAPDLPEETPDVLEENGFVSVAETVPDVLLEIRYYSTYNFVGERIDGYEAPSALLTREAAEALRAVSDDLAEQGYRLKIYDAYRPQRAVDRFRTWAADPEDTRMQAYFYPETEKSQLFRLGYIASRSGHSRGSTVDLTLVEMSTGREADMGGAFDYFGELSHAGYTAGLTEEQRENRRILRQAMTAGGFRGISTEWWHFTLEDEPYPDTYFDFPVTDRAA